MGTTPTTCRPSAVRRADSPGARSPPLPTLPRRADESAAAASSRHVTDATSVTNEGHVWRPSPERRPAFRRGPELVLRPADPSLPAAEHRCGRNNLLWIGKLSAAMRLGLKPALQADFKAKSPTVRPNQTQHQPDKRSDTNRPACYLFDTFPIRPGHINLSPCSPVTYPPSHHSFSRSHSFQAPPISLAALSLSSGDRRVRGQTFPCRTPPRHAAAARRHGIARCRHRRATGGHGGPEHRR